MSPQEIQNQINIIDKAIASPHTTPTLKEKLQAKKDELKKLLPQVKEVTKAEKKPLPAAAKKVVATKKEKIKKKTADLKDEVAVLLANVKSKVRNFNQGRGVSSIKKDMQYAGKKPGKRISASGQVYYENRPGHSDIDPKSKLARGGRLKSALMRDRRYTSQEEWEKYYDRKGKERHYHHYAAGGLTPAVNWVPVSKYPGQFTKGPDDGQKPMFSQKEIDLINDGYVIDNEFRASRNSKEKMEGYQQDKKYETILTHTDNEFGGNWRLWAKAGSFEGGGIVDYNKTTAASLWNAWSVKQRTHFLLDHFEGEMSTKNAAEIKQIAEKDFSDLWPQTKAAIDTHRKQGHYEHGGEVEETDMFQNTEDLPEDVQEILNRYSEEDNTYEVLEKMEAELNPLGYTFDFDLDAVPSNLRRIAANGGTTGNPKSIFVYGYTTKYFDQHAKLSFFQAWEKINAEKGKIHDDHSFALKKMAECVDEIFLIQQQAEKNGKLSNEELVDLTLNLLLAGSYNCKTGSAVNAAFLVNVMKKIINR